MTTKKVSINALLADPKGIINDKNHLFTVWTCSESALPKRALALIPKIKYLVSSGLVDGDSTYLSLANIVHGSSASYDVIHLFNIETGLFLGGICHSALIPLRYKESEIWIVDDNQKTVSSHTFLSWRTLKYELNNDEALKSIYEKHFNPNLPATIGE